MPWELADAVPRCPSPCTVQRFPRLITSSLIAELAFIGYVGRWLPAVMSSLHVCVSVAAAAMSACIASKVRTTAP